MQAPPGAETAPDSSFSLLLPSHHLPSRYQIRVSPSPQTASLLHFTPYFCRGSSVVSGARSSVAGPSHPASDPSWPFAGCVTSGQLPSLSVPLVLPAVGSAISQRPAHRDIWRAVGGDAGDVPAVEQTPGWPQPRPRCERVTSPQGHRRENGELRPHSECTAPQAGPSPCL